MKLTEYKPLQYLFYALTLLGFIAGVRYLREFLEPVDYLILAVIFFSLPIFIKMVRWAFLVPILPVQSETQPEEVKPILEKSKLDLTKKLLYNRIEKAIIDEMHSRKIEYLSEDDYGKFASYLGIENVNKNVIKNIVESNFQKLLFDGILYYTPFDLNSLKSPTSEKKSKNSPPKPHLGDWIDDNTIVGEGFDL